MKLGAASLNQIILDWEGNSQRIVEAINLAKQQNIDLLCLPELCITGYGCEDLFLSDWLPMRAEQMLAELLPFTDNISVCLGFPLRHNGKLFNCAAIISNAEILGIYAKRYLANDGVHYEPRWFSEWVDGEVQIQFLGKTLPFGDILFELNKKKIAIEICEDAWKAKPVSMDVDIILNPSASHFAFGKTELRLNLVQQRSKQYQCTYVYANLIGNETGRMIYDGELLIASNGELLCRQPLLQFAPVQVLSFNVGVAKIESKNELFQKAVELALFDYLRKTHSKNYVLSLSGGADSSCCAVLVADMVKRAREELGEHLRDLSGLESSDIKNILITAYQGTRNSSENTFVSAKKLAESLGATFYNWLIDEQVAGYTSILEKELGLILNWKEHDIALQNIQARTRSPIIWMLTNLSNGLLITTSNRSEGAVGYATMDGDTSGSIAPIAGVDKHFIRNWLIWAEKELGYSALSYVNELNPSAELRPLDQTQEDEVDLMPYDLLNEIEHLAIKQWQSPLSVFNSLQGSFSMPKEQLRRYVIKFFQLWSRNQWKRERIAPSFHLDMHNVDSRTWCRFPILNKGFKEEIEALQQLDLM